MLRVEVGGAVLMLLPERAAYLPEQGALLVADVHVGKAASFRGLGVPVPPGTTGGTLQRLSAALAASAARHLIVLGDFVHSARSLAAPATLRALTDWRAAHAALRITLVRGNHDRRAGELPAALGIDALDGPLACGPLLLVHEPRPAATAPKGAIAWPRGSFPLAEGTGPKAQRCTSEPEPQPGGYVLGGHLHPCVTVGARGFDRVRLPCFHFGAQSGVLPAFGEFTGARALPRADGDRVFAIAAGAVHEV